MSNFIITIDGPAASGKSTAARMLAQKLGAGFLDTGAMYRAVTLIAMQSGVDLTNERELVEVIENHKFCFTIENETMKVYVDGADTTEQIRAKEVTENAKYIAAAPSVRRILVQMQRQFAKEHGAIITEGRDQGTVAFPDADFKFFLTARPQERAKRRLTELKAKGIDANITEILESIEKRDKSDMERNVGPMKPAPDAIVIDTTELGIEQVVEQLISRINQRDSRMAK